MDAFDRAFTVLLQHVGEQLRLFMGLGRKLLPVPQEQIDAAVRELIQLSDRENVVPIVTPEQFVATRREIVAQAYEETWKKLLSPNLHDPRTRAAVIGFIEDRAGRPMELPR